MDLDKKAADFVALHDHSSLHMHRRREETASDKLGHLVAMVELDSIRKALDALKPALPGVDGQQHTGFAAPLGLSYDLEGKHPVFAHHCC